MELSLEKETIKYQYFLGRFHMYFVMMELEYQLLVDVESDQGHKHFG